MREEPLVTLGRKLRQADYRFVAITPASHARVLARDGRDARSLRDIFGWSRPFAENALPREILESMIAADVLLPLGDGRYRSAVRFATLGDKLFAHSAYPTLENDAVFFGPDTYRFCRALAMHREHRGRVVDVGCGSGAGGLTLGGERLVLSDISPRALAFARVNAELADARDVEIVESDVLAHVRGPIHHVIANPPYLRDPLGRTYRDGGGELGEALALRIVAESLERVEPGGTILIYTGAPIVAGEDIFLRSAVERMARAGATYRYEEIDPDVFGEELAHPHYASAERIAAVALTITLART